MSVGKSVRKYRELKNLTQAQLSEKTGVSQPYIAKIECGSKSPNILMLQAIARELDCTLNDLLGAEPSETDTA